MRKKAKNMKIKFIIIYLFNWNQNDIKQNYENVDTNCKRIY